MTRTENSASESESLFGGLHQKGNIQIFPELLAGENSELRGVARRLIGKSGRVKRHQLRVSTTILQPTLRNKGL